MMRRGLCWLELAVILCIVACLVALSVPLLNMLCAERVLVGKATVVSRSYTPSQSSTGTGFGISSNGKGVTPVVVSSHSRSKHVVVVDYEGRRIALETSASAWGAATEGTSVDLYELVGWFGPIEFSL